MDQISKAARALRTERVLAKVLAGQSHARIADEERVTRAGVHAMAKRAGITYPPKRPPEEIDLAKVLVEALAARTKRSWQIDRPKAAEVLAQIDAEFGHLLDFANAMGISRASGRTIAREIDPAAAERMAERGRRARGRRTNPKP